MSKRPSGCSSGSTRRGMRRAWTRSSASEPISLANRAALAVTNPVEQQSYHLPGPDILLPGFDDLF